MSKRYTYTRNASGTDGDVRTNPVGLVSNGKPQTREHHKDTPGPAQPYAQPNPPVSETMTILLSYTEGWMRFTPDTEHKTLYLKFKWRRGVFAGNYVMAVVKPHELAYGLTLLLDKVRDVYSGFRVPSRDTPYDA